MKIDGVTGPATWGVLFKDIKPEPKPLPDPGPKPEPTPTPTPITVPVEEIPSWFGEEARNAIAKDLASVSETRKKICL